METLGYVIGWAILGLVVLRFLGFTWGNRP
jgi:hypothetical protein